MLVAAVAIILVVATGHGPIERADTAARGPVLVALVLPDESGVELPRVIDVYQRSPGGWRIESVSPAQPAVVSGTSGRTLADAYTYGGGAGLAQAYSARSGMAIAGWVVVDGAAWSGLVGGATVPIDVPAHIEVFDGLRLIAFEQGPALITAEQTKPLLDGARYLSASDERAVREAIGDRLGALLTSAGRQNLSALRSNLHRAQLTGWLNDLGTPQRTRGY
jgi:hypothetical protein